MEENDASRLARRSTRHYAIQSGFGTWEEEESTFSESSSSFSLSEEDVQVVQKSPQAKEAHHEAPRRRSFRRGLAFDGRLS